MYTILLGLIASHFICDYVFQTDAIATGKNRNLDPAKFGVHWTYWMTTHAITHGVGVFLVTGNTLLALLEFFSHWAIDFAKCEKKISLHTDQILHVICKFLWIGIWLFQIEYIKSIHQILA